jgi:hypothetical protein
MTICRRRLVARRGSRALSRLGFSSRRGTRVAGTGVNAAGGGFAPRGAVDGAAPRSPPAPLSLGRGSAIHTFTPDMSRYVARLACVSSHDMSFHRDIGHVDVRSFHCFTRPRMVREPQAPSPQRRHVRRLVDSVSCHKCHVRALRLSAPAGPLLPALAGSSLRPCWDQGWLCRGQLAGARSRVCASRGESRGLTQVCVEGLRLVVVLWSEVAVLVTW